MYWRRLRLFEELVSPAPDKERPWLGYSLEEGSREERWFCAGALALSVEVEFELDCSWPLREEERTLLCSMSKRDCR